MIMLRLHDLSFFYADRPILQHVTLTFGKERTGLVGHNGGGKSTFLRLLAGELMPHSGDLQLDGSIGYLPQDFFHTSGYSIADTLDIAREIQAWNNITNGIADQEDYFVLESNWDIQARFESAAEKMNMRHLTPETPINTLSGGELVRVHCMRFLLKEYDHLLLDEPTNHLDTEGRQAIIEFLQTFRRGIIIASHDRELLRQMDRIIEIENGTCTTYGGSWDLYAEEKKQQRLALEQKIQTTSQSLKRTKQQAQETKEKQEKRNSRGAKHAAKGGIPKLLLGGRKEKSERTSGKLSTLHDKHIEENSQALSELKQKYIPTRNFSILLPPQKSIPGKIAIDMKDVSFSHTSTSLLNKISLQLRCGEKLAVTGRNGSGKSTLLELCTGIFTPDAGMIRTITPFGYLDQHCTFLDQDKTVLENFSCFHKQTTESKQRTILAEFLFSQENIHRRVRTLSGGERSRLALACLLSTEPACPLLILDEPTNHMDIASIEVIEEALKAYTGALLVVSHDEEFLDAINCVRRYYLQKTRK